MPVEEAEVAAKIRSGVEVGPAIVDEASLLETTAEVSVAFTGFIGIFLVLAARDGRFAAVDSFVIRLIVVCSIAPVFFAVLPLVLHALGLAGTTLWRISSAAVGLSWLVILAYLAVLLRALERGEGRSINYGFALVVAAVASCLGNVLGWPWTPAGGPYLVTVWATIGIAGGNFVELLFRKVL